ncbi:MAG: hypothetical protein ACOC85_01975 [Thermoplasmatota archaeon]
MAKIEVIRDERISLLSAALQLTDLWTSEEGKYNKHNLPIQVKKTLGHLKVHSLVKRMNEVIKEEPFLFIVPHFLTLTYPGLNMKENKKVEPWKTIPMLESEDFFGRVERF